MPVYRGGCACGAVRFEAAGEPKRVGICHCLACRKKHGSVLNAFAVFGMDEVHIEGPTDAWANSAHGREHSCRTCHSPVYYLDERDDEVELKLGAFDESGLFTPAYETWIIRREAWLEPLPCPQYRHDRA